jgi:hypothetical protein
MRDENKQILAEKIAALLRDEHGAFGNEQLWKAVGELGERLEILEKAVAASAGTTSRAKPVDHPSLHKYAVLEALQDPSSGTDAEKMCSFEPNGKPCDHCSMCSSRGF